ncbi:MULTISPECIES: type I-B CRISPR-associated protein Cas5b [Sporomusa]|uniref:type I-B CRISPR-associated protein Cas5b n=1 Tax=Sporomusa TaxID=2375 RepID=UPI002B7B9080|nr:type I-B CRISPR-associated protein Cas5b [Sporomusa sphaeroides]HML32872.1 type I-B CRISPR-associated protein Cas5b [Sporomusa sphaeroides]
MMNIQAVKFRLSGEAACFRKPDVNEQVYFTYNNIHRVALLGLLGAILGLRGYRNNRLFEEEQPGFPEFYEKLAGIRLALIPEAERGYFTKKVQYFNNSVGYASKELGGNLQVFEQWLEKPAWTVYLTRGTVAPVLWDKLIAYLTGQKCVYIPYLGKNDFPAVIEQATVCELAAPVSRGPLFINSLFPGALEDIDDTETQEDQQAYIFSERAPVALQPKHNFYIFQQILFTNYLVERANGELWQDGTKVLCFF